MRMAQFLQCVTLIVGSCLLGSVFGWQVGLGVGCIGYTLMPYQVTNKVDQKGK